MTQATNQIIHLADLYGAHRNLSHWRVSFLLSGNGQFIKRLKDGAGCNVKTHEKSILWVYEAWPKDLEWPPIVLVPPKPAVKTNTGDAA